MNRFQAVIFDLDGTIIDTEHIWKRAIKDLLHIRGIAVCIQTEELLQQRMNGMALNQSCSFLKDHFQLPDALSVLIQEKTDRANSIYQKEVRFVNGFLEFYGQVIQKNLKTGVATNAHDLTVAVTEKALGLSKLFGQHIYSISCVDNKGKPDPAIYLHAADKLQIAPENCIAIEDSAHGLSAARKAGMFCIGINTSGRRTELAQAHRVIDEYHELDLDHLLHHPH